MSDTGEDGTGVVVETAPTTAPAVPDENGKTHAARHYNDLWKLATLTTSTQMVPKSLRGRPEEAFAVMVYGSELGIAPMAALRSIYIIEGQPTCSAQLMRGLIQAAGHILSWRKVTQDRVELYGRRRDNGSDATVVWTLDDAKRAKLVGKGNWATYPRSMLAARATSELARLLFADILHGLSYTPEELGAVGPMAAIDIEYDPARDGKVVDRETGEILDEPEPEPEDEPDADDIEDAEWIQAALQPDQDETGA